jgi:hypothetical protein
MIPDCKFGVWPPQNQKTFAQSRTSAASAQFKHGKNKVANFACSSPDQKHPNLEHQTSNFKPYPSTKNKKPQTKNTQTSNLKPQTSNLK